jgi:hypothetical protein
MNLGYTDSKISLQWLKGCLSVIVYWTEGSTAELLSVNQSVVSSSMRLKLSVRE